MELSGIGNSHQFDSHLNFTFTSKQRMKPVRAREFKLDRVMFSPSHLPLFLFSPP